MLARWLHSTSFTIRQLSMSQIKRAILRSQKHKVSPATSLKRHVPFNQRCFWWSRARICPAVGLDGQRRYPNRLEDAKIRRISVKKNSQSSVMHPIISSLVAVNVRRGGQGEAHSDRYTRTGELAEALACKTLTLRRNLWVAMGERSDKKFVERHGKRVCT